MKYLATLLLILLLSFSVSDVFANAGNSIGRIQPPPGVEEYINENVASGASQDDNALLFFVSRMVRLSTIVAGIWVLINFIAAGYFYITSSGDAGVHQKVKNLLTMSVLGLVFIVFSYTIAGLISLLIFGDAGFILNPQITGPTP